MSIFEIFQPGLRFGREQQDFDKVRVLTAEEGGTPPDCPVHVDLTKGIVTIARKADAPQRPEES